MRSGDFRKDVNGAVVTVEGYFLDPQITIADDVAEIVIARDGTVTTFTSNSDAGTQAGTLSLFRFANTSGLKAQAFCCRRPRSGYFCSARLPAFRRSILRNGSHNCGDSVPSFTHDYSARRCGK